MCVPFLDSHMSRDDSHQQTNIYRHIPHNNEKRCPTSKESQWRTSSWPGSVWAELRFQSRLTSPPRYQWEGCWHPGKGLHTHFQQWLIITHSKCIQSIRICYNGSFSLLSYSHPCAWKYENMQTGLLYWHVHIEGMGSCYLIKAMWKGMTAVAGHLLKKTVGLVLIVWSNYCFVICKRNCKFIDCACFSRALWGML